MVRIIQNEKEKEKAREQVREQPDGKTLEQTSDKPQDKCGVKTGESSLDEKSKVLLQVIGISIADNPQAIQDLLEDYSIELKDPTEQELIDNLLMAIGENNKDFNRELARIILDSMLDQSYDSFDIKSLLGSGGSGEGAAPESGGNNSGGLWSSVASAISGISGAVGQGLKNKSAREQATSQTLQGIYAYKAQQANNEKSKANSKMLMLIGLFVLLGLAITAIAYFSRKPQVQTIPIKS